MKRRGTTLVELLVGLGLTALVAAGAWALMSGLDRRSRRLGDYAQTLRQVAMLRAELTRDLGNLMVPPGAASQNAVELGPDELVLSFATTIPHADPILADATPISEEFTWTLEPVDGGWRLTREGAVTGAAEDRGLVFEAARLRLEEDSLGRPVAVFEGAVALPARAGSPARSIPLKVSRTIRAPGRILTTGGYPRTILPSPPNPPGIPTGRVQIPLRP